jgi:hypothetical protein
MGNQDTKTAGLFRFAHLPLLISPREGAIGRHLEKMRLIGASFYIGLFHIFGSGVPVSQ